MEILGAAATLQLPLSLAREKEGLLKSHAASSGTTNVPSLSHRLNSSVETVHPSQIVGVGEGLLGIGVAGKSSTQSCQQG